MNRQGAHRLLDAVKAGTFEASPETISDALRATGDIPNPSIPHGKAPPRDFLGSGDTWGAMDDDDEHLERSSRFLKTRAQTKVGAHLNAIAHAFHRVDPKVSADDQTQGTP